MEFNAILWIVIILLTFIQLTGWLKTQREIEELRHRLDKMEQGEDTAIYASP